jgi:ubiquitin-small subunit ribosomal protein S27Ae
MADKKKPVEKAKKPKKQAHESYNISGDSITCKNINCPKCGPGVFLGKHSDRVVCGKCKYVEYLKKESSE